MRAVLVLVTVVAILLGWAPMAEASGKGRSSGAKSSRPKTTAVKKHERKLPGGKRVPVKAHKRSEAQR